MTILIVLSLAVISLLFIYEDDVKGLIIKELNKNLNAEIKVDPNNIHLIFIKTFPDCAIQFKDITCMEAIQSRKRDTLMFAHSLQLKFDVKDLWNKKYNIKKIHLSEAFCRLKINSKGKPNYNVWKQEKKENKTNDSLNFSLESIEFKNVNFFYHNIKEKLKIELALNDIDFSGKFSESDYELKSEGKLKIGNITSGQSDYLKDKNVSYKADVEVVGNKYLINGCEIHFNQMLIEANGHIIYGDSLSDMDLTFNGKNLEIQSVLSLLPESHKKKISDYSSDGNFYAAGHLKYKNGLEVNVDFGVHQTTIVYQPKNAKLTGLNATGKFRNANGQSYLELKNVSGNLMSDFISGDIVIMNFNDPFLDLKLSGTLNLENLIRFWPMDTLTQLKGAISFKSQIKSTISELKKNTIAESSVFDLEASLSNLVIQFKNQKDSMSIKSCDLKAKNRSVAVTNLVIQKGRSDLQIDGRLEGAYHYIMDNKNPLKIYGNLKSKNIVMEDFIFEETFVSNEKTEIELPSNINFVLDASIDALSFRKFSASRILGNIELKNKKVLADNITMHMMEGSGTIDALIDLSGKNMEVNFHSEVLNLNVTHLFAQLNNFNQTTLNDHNIGGVVTSTIDFSGTWNKYLEPELNSMKAVCDLKIDQGILVDFKPLESLSKFVDLNDLKSIKFSSLQSRIEINKSVITIPKTVIKNSALNINVWGTHSFNNEIDYHVQLLISELLSKKRKANADEEFGPVENDSENHRSAFVLMTGTVDNPIMKYDRKGLKQKIKEDLKQEKQTLKQLLKDEFGLFKNDSIKKKEVKKSDQQFKLEKNQPTKKENLKKKEEEDDF